MFLKNTFTFIVKQIFSYLFFILGGVYWVKALLRGERCLIVLNYHNFSKYNNYKINRGNIIETGFSSNFDKQVRFLKKHFNFCYPDDFFNERCEGINMLLTFDDGYKDNFDLALPILKKYDASAIFFLTTNYIDTDNWLLHDKVRYLVINGMLDQIKAEDILLRMNDGHLVDKSFINWANEKFPEISPKKLMMNWNEINIICQLGLHIGSHTANHAVLSLLENTEQTKEIKHSIESIKLRTGVDCIYLAYPNGLFNETTLELLEKHSIKYAFTVNPGLNYQSTNLKQLKRIGINPSDSIPLLLLKILLSCLK